jgi:hypothetical protein
VAQRRRARGSKIKFDLKIELTGAAAGVLQRELMLPLIRRAWNRCARIAGNSGHL